MGYTRPRSSAVRHLCTMRHGHDAVDVYHHANQWSNVSHGCVRCEALAPRSNAVPPMERDATRSAMQNISGRRWTVRPLRVPAAAARDPVYRGLSAQLSPVVNFCFFGFFSFLGGDERFINKSKQHTLCPISLTNRNRTQCARPRTQQQGRELRRRAVPRRGRKAMRCDSWHDDSPGSRRMMDGRRPSDLG